MQSDTPTQTAFDGLPRAAPFSTLPPLQFM
jgi:hypothetical protein